MASKNILIVDDSASQRIKLKHDLEKHNYNVTDVEDAETAILEIGLNKPDLIISDVVMPGMDGYEFCRKMKSSDETRNIPFILLTSLSDPEDVIKGLESKTDNFITKPYEEDELISRIQYVLMNDEMRHKKHSSSIGIDIYFGGKRHVITSERVQILDLLFSTFENSLKQNEELKSANKKLKQLSVELKEKNEKLNKLNEDKNRFLRIAAHDIRNPAHVILQSYSIVKDEVFDLLGEEEKEILPIIENAAESILQLLNEILDIAVIESGELKMNIKEIDLIDLVDSVILFNNSIAKEKNISVKRKSEHEELFIPLDKVKIEQVLNNLLSNALKYSNKDTETIIEVSKYEDYVQLSVIDQGLGIPKDEQEKLFKPFSTAGVKATAGEKSTGLGLSIVKKIVQAHDGEIWCESEVGKGSEFHVKLPIRK